MRCLKRFLFADEHRKTGVKLKELPRDANDLEIPDGMFDPTPGRPSTRKPGRHNDGKSTSSETMVIAESRLRALCTRSRS